MGVLGRNGEIEAAAKGSDILVIVGTQGIAAMVGDHCLGGDAAHRLSSDQASSGQRGGRKHVAALERAVDPVPLFVDDNGVDIDQPASRVAQHEVPGAGIVAGDIAVAARFQQGAKPGQVVPLDDDVEVGVVPRLFTKQRIDALPAVDPDGNAQLLQSGVQLDDLAGRQ